MAAQFLRKGVPLEVTLATTCTRLVPGDDISVIWVQVAGDVYLVLDNTVADGAAVPATARFVLPAGSKTGIEVRDRRPLLAAVSGTVVVSLLGMDAPRAGAQCTLARGMGV